MISSRTVSAEADNLRIPAGPRQRHGAANRVAPRDKGLKLLFFPFRECYFFGLNEEQTSQRRESRQNERCTTTAPETQKAPAMPRPFERLINKWRE